MCKGGKRETTRNEGLSAFCYDEKGMRLSDVLLTRSNVFRPSSRNIMGGQVGHSYAKKHGTEGKGKRGKRRGRTHRKERKWTVNYPP